ncbi:interleukin-17B-like [Clavelina lepadiformis]|uniref:Uncharacterized protein n=1 Tax=Clavelina lepadiformis TaxID=159417 RepID=A0ABP0EVG7_CLALP
MSLGELSMRLVLLALFLLILGHEAYCRSHHRRTSNNNCRRIRSVDFRILRFSLMNYIKANNDTIWQLSNATATACPQQLSDLWSSRNESSDPIRLRSLSPYEYYIDRDPSRFPQDIIKARCLCDVGCFDPTTYRIDKHLNSEPINLKMNVIVFLRDGINVEDCNESTCRIESLNIAVGCQCTHPIYVSN